jgi:anti-sigma regulatory factor (Ser/Thr protein kinase)
LPQSIEELVRAVSGSVTPEGACLSAVDRLVPDLGPDDDVAAIAIQIDPVTDVLELELPATPAMLMRLRHALGRWLRGHAIEGDAVIEVTLAVSEACANAIEHAYGPSRGRFRVRAELNAETIEVHVSDQGHWRPPRGAHRGRGLRIMRAAMDRLDIYPDDYGTEIVMSRDLNS